MPRYVKIPTDEEQDAWEQNKLIPSMLSGIAEDVKRLSLETQKSVERIKANKLEIEEMKKHGKFVNGEYIPNSEAKPTKSNKKQKKQEDSDSEYEPNEIKKITDSVLKDKLLKIKNETKEIKVFLKK